jgi:hypothetical protein
MAALKKKPEGNSPSGFYFFILSHQTVSAFVGNYLLRRL